MRLLRPDLCKVDSLELFRFSIISDYAQRILYPIEGMTVSKSHDFVPVNIVTYSLEFPGQ